MRQANLTWILGSALFVGVLLCLSGCGSDQRSIASGGVAIVDLDVVAQKLGHDVEIRQSVKQKQKSLNKQMTTMQAVFLNQQNQKKTDFGAILTSGEEETLRKLNAQLNIQLSRSRKNAQLDLERHRQSLVDDFRKKLKPVIREVAAEKGLSIVIPKDKRLLLTVNPDVDITDEVIQKLLAKRSAGSKKTTEPSDSETPDDDSE